MREIDQLNLMLDSHPDMLKLIEARATLLKELQGRMPPRAEIEALIERITERRGGQTVSRQPHNLEIVGSTPTPAISLEFVEKFAEGMGCKLWIEEQKPPEQAPARVMDQFFIEQKPPEEGTWRTREPML